MLTWAYITKLRIVHARLPNFKIQNSKTKTLEKDTKLMKNEHLK